MWITGSIEAAGEIKKLADDNLHIVESKANGDEEVSLLVAYNPQMIPTFLAIVNKAKMLVGSGPERKKPACNTECFGDATAAPRKEMPLNQAFHFLNESEEGSSCNCAGCSAMQSLLNFVRPFVRHMEEGVHLQLTGRADVDDAIVKQTLINGDIIRRGCCPNDSCKCERLIPSPNKQRRYCPKCNFNVPASNCE